MTHWDVIVRERDELRAEAERLRTLWHEGNKTLSAEVERLKVENRKLRSLTEAALIGLYNGFEPDNQSALYNRIKAALRPEPKP